MFFDKSSFDSAKSREKVKCTCSQCGSLFYMIKSKICAKIKHNETKAFCSRKCVNENNITSIETSCTYCGKKMRVFRSIYFNSLTKHFFCTKRCSALYNNPLRKTSEATKEKISKSLKKFYKENKEPPRCKVCGCIECEHPEICKNNFIVRKSVNLEKLGFDFTKLGTKEIYKEYYKLRDLLFEEYIVNQLTLTEISNKYKMGDAKCIKNLLEKIGIKTRNKSEAMRIHHDKIDDAISNTMSRNDYKRKSLFKYNDEFKKCEGYENVVKYGRYDSIKNPKGYVGDHMLSREYGYQHSIDLSIIRHPANCRFITQEENLKKGKNSIITLDELLDRIKNW